jgi:hypothetical protein
MALFKPAETTSAYLKMGLLGFAGSGKTKTAALTAIGLIKLMRERGLDLGKKPAFFLDTETGVDWVAPDFRAAGIQLETAKTRAFADLLMAVEEAQANGSLLLIDSISHFWKELCDTYQKKKAQQFKNSTYRLQFQDWGYLKGEWGKFTDAFINSPLHIILAGRAGYEYDYFEEEGGRKELEKTGIKMKAEGEMGYEPSLLVLMERNQRIENGSVAATWREATILKDRSTLLDGKVFRDPTFADFLPHVERLNLGGKQLGVDTSRTSEHMIPKDRRDYAPVQRKIVIDEIQTLLTLHHPGQSAQDKTTKLKLLLKHFDASWVEIEEVMPLDRLREGYDGLYRELEKKPSKYGSAIEKDNASLDMNDELPDFATAPAAQTAPETKPAEATPAQQAAKAVEERLAAEAAAPKETKAEGEPKRRQTRKVPEQPAASVTDPGATHTTTMPSEGTGMVANSENPAPVEETRPVERSNVEPLRNAETFFAEIALMRTIKALKNWSNTVKAEVNALPEKDAIWTAYFDKIDKLEAGEPVQETAAA